MAYIVALVLVVVFATNVVMGAMGSALFSTLVEMLVLFGAAISFSVGILRAEAREKAKTSNDR